MKVESGIMTIATPHMSIAADIVQSIAQTFNMDVVQVNNWNIYILYRFCLLGYLRILG